MTFNTGNPIGSTDARDLSDNAENFDKALGTLDATWTDRLGVTRDSFEGRLAKGSFYRVGAFSSGYTLTNMRQTLEYNGHEYSWAGTFPKVVAAGATPSTSGGIGAGAWVDRTDVTLRSELSETDSQIVIAGEAAEDIRKSSVWSGEYDILFVYGQSNALGKPSLSGDTSGFPVPVSRSLIFDSATSTLTPMQQTLTSWSGGGDGVSSGHAWASFANEWYRQTKRGVILVMGAQGGTTIAQLSKGAGTGYYEGAVSGMTALSSYLSSHPSYVINSRMCIFHQGESDQSATTTFEQYRAALVALFDNLITDAGINYFGICTVGCPDNRPEYRWSVIQNAQRYVAAGRELATIAFDGCPSFNTKKEGMVGTEGTHYTQKGLNTMGYFAAKNMFDFCFNSSTRRSEAENYKYGIDQSVPWTRPFNAIACVKSNGSVFALRHRDDSFGGTFRPVNVQSQEVSSDGKSLLFKLSDKPANHAKIGAFTDDASVKAVAGVYVNGTDYYVKVDFYIDFTIGIKPSTAEKFIGAPLAATTSGVASLISVTTDGTIATITHADITDPALASFYPDGSFTDTTAFVACRTISATQTKLKVTATTNPVAAVRFTGMHVTPNALAVAKNGLNVFIDCLELSEF